MVHFLPAPMDFSFLSSQTPPTRTEDSVWTINPMLVLSYKHYIRSIMFSCFLVVHWVSQSCFFVWNVLCLFLLYFRSIPNLIQLYSVQCKCTGMFCCVRNTCLTENKHDYRAGPSDLAGYSYFDWLSHLVFQNFLLYVCLFVYLFIYLFVCLFFGFASPIMRRRNQRFEDRHHSILPTPLS